MPIRFDDWKTKNAGAGLMTRERTDLLTSFSVGAQKVVDNLWLNGNQELAQKFSDLVNASLYVRFDPALVEEAGNAEAWQNGVDTLDGVAAFLNTPTPDGMTNFDLLMQLGTQGEEPAFGENGEVFFDWMQMLQDTVEVKLDPAAYQEQFRGLQSISANVRSFASQEMPQEEAPVNAPSEPVMNEQPDIIQPAELNEQPRSAASILQSFRDDAASAYAQITAVDYNLFGMGSPEFKDMKNALKDLHNYARNTMQLSPDNRGLSITEMAHYIDLQDRAIEMVQKYIDHKQEDMLKDPSRKNSSRRQSHEQPRIKNALNVLQKLKTQNAINKKEFISNVRRYGSKRMDDLLAKEEATRQNLTSDQKKEYMQSVNRTMLLLENRDGKNWYPQKGESFEHFAQRSMSYYLENTYFDVDENDYQRQGRLSRSTLSEAEKRFSGKNGYQQGHKMTTEELRKNFMQYHPDYAPSDLEKIPQDQIINETTRDVDAYKSLLLSDKTLNNIWEDQRVTEYFYMKNFLQNIGSIFSKEQVDKIEKEAYRESNKDFLNEANAEDEADRNLNFNSILMDDMMFREENARDFGDKLLKDKNGYQAPNPNQKRNVSRVTLSNGHTFNSNESFCTINALQDSKTLRKHYIQEIEEMKKAEFDPLSIRSYDDQLFLLHTDSTVLSEILENVPYLPTLTGALATGNKNTDGKGLAEARNELSAKLVDSSMDFTHAIIEEYKMAMQKQQLGKTGMTPAQEKQYLADLYKAHNNLLKAYEEKGGFYDDPEKKTSKHFGNVIAHDYGREGLSSSRQLNSVVGMVNGEKRAIENNWKADELSVMAMVGCLEANFDQVEKVTPPDKQKELLQMRLEFLNLKNQCWNKYVECSADKAEIAEKVHAFVEKHRGDPKWERIFHDTKELMPELHKALLTTKRRAGMDREKDLAFRNEPLMDKVEKQFQEAMQTGEFTQFAHTMSKAYYQYELEKFSKEDMRRYVAFTDKYVDVLQKNPELRDKYMLTLNNLKNALYIDDMKNREYITQGIQQGLYPIDPELEQQRMHTPLAASYAAQVPLPYSDILASDHLVNGLKNSLYNDPQYVKDLLSKSQSAFYENYHDMTSPIEREGKIRKHHALLNDKMNDCGIKYDSLNNKYQKYPDEKWRKRSAQSLESCVKGIEEFTRKVHTIAETAQNAYNVLHTVENPSPELKNLLYGLQNAAKLNAHNTPRQVSDAFERLRHDTLDYLQHSKGSEAEAQNIAFVKDNIQKELMFEDTKEELKPGEKWTEKNYMDDFYQKTHPYLNMYTPILTQHMEAVQQLEAQLLTFPLSEKDKNAVKCPSAQAQKLKAEDAQLKEILSDKLHKDGAVDLNNWTETAMRAARESLKDSAGMVPDYATSKTVAPQLSRIIGLNIMKQAIINGDKSLNSIKTPDDFMKAVRAYSKEAASISYFDNMTSNMTVGSANEAVTSKPDGKGLYSQMVLARAQYNNQLQAAAQQKQMGNQKEHKKDLGILK